MNTNFPFANQSREKSGNNEISAISNYLNTLKAEIIRKIQETAWLYQREVPKYDCGAFWYADNHKINLDTGACWTGIAVMLDLDTFDEHIFQGEPMNG